MAAPDATAAAAARLRRRRAHPGGELLRAEGVGRDRGLRGLDGSVAGYLGNQTLVLATQVGGRAPWARPWAESASISGGAGGTGADGKVRGYSDGRFRGDSSLYGNAELRLGGRLPQEGGAVLLRWGLYDNLRRGRAASQRGEDSKKWHTGVGVGLQREPTGTPTAFGG